MVQPKGVTIVLFGDSFLASAGAVDEADFENAFYDAPDVKVCTM